jgi:hypothetical protein
MHKLPGSGFYVYLQNYLCKENFTYF